MFKFLIIYFHYKKTRSRVGQKRTQQAKNGRLCVGFSLDEKTSEAIAWASELDAGCVGQTHAK